MSIKRLKALQYIYLDNNHLTSMGELPTNLISISCNKNQIGPMLHDTITNLKALRFFDCEQNKLELLSHTMGRMTRLKRFNVANNKVRRIRKRKKGKKHFFISLVFELQNQLYILTNTFDRFPTFLHVLHFLFLCSFLCSRFSFSVFSPHSLSLSLFSSHE